MNARGCGFDPEGVGQHSPGQRPGFAVEMNGQAESLRQNNHCPRLSAWKQIRTQTRALPWAMLSQPFGLKTEENTRSRSPYESAEHTRRAGSGKRHHASAATAAVADARTAAPRAGETTSRVARWPPALPADDAPARGTRRTRRRPPPASRIA